MLSVRTKMFRRWGVPLAILVALSMYNFNGVIAWFATWGILSIGYGTKTIYSDDPGSPLGNFMLDHLGEKWGKWASRATIIINVWTIWGLAWVLS